MTEGNQTLLILLNIAGPLLTGLMIGARAADSGKYPPEASVVIGIGAALVWPLVTVYWFSRWIWQSARFFVRGLLQVGSLVKTGVGQIYRQWRPARLPRATLVKDKNA